MSPIFKNFIDGQWVKSLSGKIFEDRNPANSDQIVGIFQRSNHKDVELAVTAAKEAYPSWKNYPTPKKGEILFRVAEILKNKKEALARELTQEMGKVLKEARGDIQEAIDMAYYCAGEGRRLYGETTPSELTAKFCMSVRMPIGVVAAISPWNFPMAIPSWKLMPALICGNTVVFKPASDTPLIALRLVEIFEEAGLPPGVLNLVTGTGAEAGQSLLTNPEIKMVSFTGSLEVGRTVSGICGRGMKKYSLEMGGKNAIIIMDDAHLDLAVEGSVWGAFGTTGQRCTAASRLIVHKKIIKDFTNRLWEKTKKLKIGDGLAEDTDVGPVINNYQLKKIDQYAKIGKGEGAKLLCGGKIYRKGLAKKGFFYEPTIFTDVHVDMRIAQEEIFGPIVSIIPVADFEEAIETVNNSQYGLSSSIYTQDVNLAFQAIRDVDTGITYINSSTIGAEVHLPFGGTKSTGNGHREAGRQALDTFSEWKTIYVDYSGKLQKAQMDN